LILHLVTDEKFIDMAYRAFEAAAPRKNRFIIVGNPIELKHIKKAEIEFVPRYKIRKFLEVFDYRAIVLHSLDSGLTHLSYVPTQKRILWLGWGFDYYSRLLSSAYPDGLLETKTAALDKSHQPKRSLNPIHLMKAISRSIIRNDIRLKRNVSRIDYFSPVLESEYKLAKDLNPWLKAEYLPWNYGVAEDDFACFVDNTKDKKTAILVGNSATAENNHIEVLDILSRADNLKNYDVIVPLSYGKPWYRDAVINYGHELLGERFKPVTAFMPLDHYVRMVNSCSIVIMNHIRQQAVGNIVISLLAGSTVVLNEKSPVYAWLKEQGANVKRLSSINEIFDQELSARDLHINVKIVYDRWGRQVQHAKTLEVVKTLIGDDL
jgi:dTDP-N-acetylfucosamine:lipid II N-acetylfucosaminyltransferase